MKSEMTIGRQLSLCFGALLVCCVIIGAVSWGVVGGMIGSLQSIRHSGDAVGEIGQVTTAASDMRSAEAGFILFSALNDTSQIEGSRQAFKEAGDRLGASIGRLRETVGESSLGASADRLDGARRQLVEQFGQMVAQCAEQRCDQALELHKTKALAASRELEAAARALSASQASAAAEVATQSDRSAFLGRWATVALVVASLVIGAVVFLVLRRLTGRLAGFARSMQQCAEEIANAAGEVRSASRSLADGTSRQAAALEETSATGEEMSAMTKSNASHARETVDLVTKSDQTVGEANRTLERMVSSMRQINSSSQKISQIIKVIDEIAFQTNILALNAAVEAARAGDAGMGFAVVADEVRNLAQRSAQAAKDTANLIEESIVRSNEGTVNLDQVGAAIQSITDLSAKMSKLIDSVHQGSTEQAKGIEQVSRAVAEMSQITQQTATTAAENASLGETMSAQAGTMQDLVEELMVLVDSDHRGRVAAAA
jgi:methyl-accepting chemotaxis protein